MKIKIRFLALLTICVFSFLLSACTGSSQDRDNDPKVAEETEQEQKEKSRDEEEKNSEPVFKEVSENSGRFDKNYVLRLSDDVKKEIPSNPYANTNEDGSVDLYASDIQEGTPYSRAGVIYDHDLFTLKEYNVYDPGVEDIRSAGAGTLTTTYRLVPLKTGESLVSVLDVYFVKNVFIGNAYHITVDEDMRCRIDWHCYVTQGENCKVKNHR